MLLSRQVVVPFWYNGWLVALADILAGCFVLTSLARQDVKHTSAKLIAVSALPVHSGAMHARWPVACHGLCCTRPEEYLHMR